MQTHHTIAAVRAAVQAFRAAGERVALVPTMGNLHAGHYALIATARQHAERVVASVFVNPTQFGLNEDYSRYPRTLAADQEGLARASCDALFAPDADEMYGGEPDLVQVSVPSLSASLCGEFRPGHFQGVATVVTKLFNIVAPDVAVFGEKDFQQLAVIRSLVRGLNLPIAIIGLPTVREADGVAMSSRNQYLLPDQRAVAPLIYQTLQAIARRFQSGESVETLEAYGHAQLRQVGFEIDYVAIRDALNLSTPAPDRDAVVLAAARIGTTRLIDNFRIAAQ
jgi:pantoate--beta-alanine ligase